MMVKEFTRSTIHIMTNFSVPTSESKTGSRVRKLRQVTRLLDSAFTIPGTKIKFGLDPLLGLIPGGGDTVSLLLSGYIVIEAALMGLPRNLLMQMALNLVLDTVLGAVPVLGDLFDVTYKANTLNLELLESHLRVQPVDSKKVDRLFLGLLIIGLILFAIAAASISLLVISVFGIIFRR
jgi:hypothetical protein